jgi:hypothetical protein
MEEKQKLELIAQKLDNKKKRLEIIEVEKELQMSDKKMVLEQINNLRSLITETILDPEQTVFASEKKYRLVFDEQEINKLKKKIWDLLD